MEAKLSNELLVGGWSVTNEGTGDAIEVTFHPNRTVDWKEGDKTKKGRITIEGTDKIRINWDPPTRPNQSVLSVSELKANSFTARDANATYSFEKD